MVVSHNLQAANAQRQYLLTNTLQKKSTEKLSSGYRINRAADDAAGLSISEKMRWQVRGFDRGGLNTMDGISVCQIMDGALSEVHDMLHRINELAVQAANDTNTSIDRAALQNEIDLLVNEVDRTTESTTFNTKQLLRSVEGIWNTTPSNPSGKADIVFLIDTTGSMGGHINNVTGNLTDFATALHNCDVRYGVVEYGEYSEGTGKVHPITSNVETVLNTLKSIRVNGGGDAPESALEGLSDSLRYSFRDDAIKEIILITDASYHYDGDGTTNSSTKTATQTKSDLTAAGANLTVITTSGNKSLYSSTLADGEVLDINGNFHDSLDHIARSILGRAGGTYYKSPEDLHIQHSSNVGDYSYVYTYNLSAATLNLLNLSVENYEKAGDAVQRSQEAVDRVSSVRANIGANQNRLEHSYNNVSVSSENTQASESRIRDTDMAKEMVRLSVSNILARAGESMITQANQTPQGVLTLLQ